MSEGYIFSVQDYRGKVVIFTRKKWGEKQSDHPELHKKQFLECVKRALEKPDEVWEDYGDREHRRCYYRKYSPQSYAKVVVWISDNPCVVVTAYEINFVKENKYTPQLKRLV